MLVVVCGPPGTGKTTVAEWLAAHLDAALLRTDVVRTEVIDDPDYAEAERERVYEALFARIEDALAGGRDIVADGTFDRVTYRARAREIAGRADVRFELVRVTCDPATVERRIERRGDDESDATVADYRAIRERFDPVTDAHLRVDNGGSWEATERSLRARFAQ